MNEETLKVIGRKHKVNDIIEKFHDAREAGFENINMDIIVGLPGEGIREIQHTMDELYILNPDSITIHTMAVKRASKLNEQKYSIKNNDINEMYALASSGIRKMGMFPYYMYRQKNMISPLENVGYCKPNKECIYNIQMIAENISIVAMGADAVSKIVFHKENRIERYANLKDVREYINRIDEIISKKREAVSFIYRTLIRH
jgi:oxygen-independent coproporphyrinogen-3 oxidase